MIYKIPSGFVQTEYVVSKSRFITSIQYTASREETNNFIKLQKAEIQGANHYVYAFRIGFGNSVTEGMSDDGEPSGTSGPPTLSVVRGSDIGDITIVTARYFGGTKLGTGGLVRAYTKSAQEALSVLPTILNTPKITLNVTLAYSLYDHAKHVFQQYKVEVKQESFLTEIDIELIIVEDEKSQFIEELAYISAGSICVEVDRIG